MHTVNEKTTGSCQGGIYSSDLPEIDRDDLARDQRPVNEDSFDGSDRSRWDVIVGYAAVYEVIRCDS